MRNVRLWRGLLGVDKRTVIEDIEFDQEGADGVQLVVARVRPRSGVSRRCGRCGRRAPWYDRGEGRRRWRGLDWGTVQVVLEADAPRVNCPAHGPTVVAVPWARHHAGHTLGFDDTVAWLAVACSKTAVCELMRIAWRTVGAIVARVWADADKTVDRFANLRRIGIDEISYKRHHKYLYVRPGARHHPVQQRQRRGRAIQRQAPTQRVFQHHPTVTRDHRAQDRISSRRHRRHGQPELGGSACGAADGPPRRAESLFAFWPFDFDRLAASRKATACADALGPRARELFPEPLPYGSLGKLPRPNLALPRPQRRS